MLILIRIAFRNLLEHKAKSLIVGIIMALGVIVLIVGNSFMDTAAAGLRTSFIDNFTGDIFVSGIGEGTVSLFGTQATTGFAETPRIPRFEDVRSHIAADPRINDFTGQLSTFGTIALDAEEVPEDPELESAPQGETQTPFTLLFGVEPEQYGAMFDTLKIIEGSSLLPGYEGVLLNKKRVETLNRKYGKELKIGDQIILNGFDAAGFKIRSVTLRGIYEYKSESEAMQMVSYCDVNTARSLAGLTLGGDEEVVLSGEQQTLLNTGNTDDLFGGDTALFTQASTSKSEPAVKDEPKTERVKAVVDVGAWHFILAKSKNPAEVPAIIKSLNDWFETEGIKAKAGDWKVAAGPYGISVDVFRVIFNIAVILVAVVAIIIIMNTLVVSVIERTGEIGTMRALGAHKSFVWKMFLTETFTISFVFGIIGVLLSLAIVVIVNAIGFKADNQFLEIIFGGKVLKTGVTPSSILSTLVLMLGVGFVAHIYPVLVALKIQPVRAMQTE